MSIDYGHAILAGGIWTSVAMVASLVSWLLTSGQRQIGLPEIHVDAPMPPVENPRAGRQQSEPLVGRVSDEVWRDNAQDHTG